MERFDDQQWGHLGIMWCAGYAGILRKIKRLVDSLAFLISAGGRDGTRVKRLAWYLAHILQTKRSFHFGELSNGFGRILFETIYFCPAAVGSRRLIAMTT